jgi:phosphate transport system substrate-binding protein
MKKTILLFLLALIVTLGKAQTASTLRITGTRFTFPVFKKWAEEYRKIHPEVTILVASGIPADSADILIASHILKPTDVKEGQTSLALTRYVQLPVVNSARPDLQTLAGKGFTEATFRQIYFTDTSSGANTFHSPYTVYKRQKAACSSVAFANHFGGEHKDIKGTGVAGDDEDLLEAVKTDINAVSHNSLGIIYDIQTRKVNDSIAIIPIDLNENGKIDADEKIYATLDGVVSFVEKTNHLKIPTENVNVIFSATKNHQAVTDFLSWVITKGQQFNHQFGLLKLSASTIQQEQALLAKTTALKSCTPSLAALKNNAIKSGIRN